MRDIQTVAGEILEETEKIIVGKREKIRLIIMAVLANGHVLLDDLPGVGDVHGRPAAGHVHRPAQPDELPEVGQVEVDDMGMGGGGEQDLFFHGEPSRVIVCPYYTPLLPPGQEKGGR